MTELVMNIRTWLTEIQQSDLPVTLVENSVDHAVENHVLKAIDDDPYRGL